MAASYTEHSSHCSNAEAASWLMHTAHGPDRHLQVVRQLCPASIARVHGDEDATGGHQAQLTPLKAQAKLVRSCCEHDFTCVTYALAITGTAGDSNHPVHLKCEFGHPCTEGVLDGGELLSNHRQHLNIDAIEFVKAGPGAALR